jgi:cytochrome c2
VRKRTLLFVVFALVFAACGGGNGDSEKAAPTEESVSAASVAGDAANGKELFNQTVVGSQPGCVTCHSLDPDGVLVGPSLAAVASRAGSRVAGKSAEEYLRESILNPDAFTVDGFPEGVMPGGLAGELSDQQTADLVAYLLTLK